jgi:hypothetical protein
MGYMHSKLKELFEGINTTIFGEVYGGKCQGMSETYGKEMKLLKQCWIEICPKQLLNLMNAIYGLLKVKETKKKLIKL